jgi:hypothetical protein
MLRNERKPPPTPPFEGGETFSKLLCRTEVNNVSEVMNWNPFFYSYTVVLIQVETCDLFFSQSYADDSAE